MKYLAPPVDLHSLHLPRKTSAYLLPHVAPATQHNPYMQSLIFTPCGAPGTVQVCASLCSPNWPVPTGNHHMFSHSPGSTGLFWRVHYFTMHNLEHHVQLCVSQHLHAQLLRA